MNGGERIDNFAIDIERDWNEILYEDVVQYNYRKSYDDAYLKYNNNNNCYYQNDNNNNKDDNDCNDRKRDENLVYIDVEKDGLSTFIEKQPNINDKCLDSSSFKTKYLFCSSSSQSRTFTFNSYELLHASYFNL